MISREYAQRVLAGIAYRPLSANAVAYGDSLLVHMQPRTVELDG